MTTKPEDNGTTWVKANIFSIVNLFIILVGLAFNYGAVSSRLVALEFRDTEQQKIITDLVNNGHPAHEARITALEKKTDDLAVLKQIVQTQNDSISKLSDLVRSDHDILIRLTMQKP